MHISCIAAAPTHATHPTGRDAMQRLMEQLQLAGPARKRVRAAKLLQWAERNAWCCAAPAHPPTTTLHTTTSRIEPRRIAPCWNHCRNHTAAHCCNHTPPPSYQAHFPPTPLTTSLLPPPGPGRRFAHLLGSALRVVRVARAGRRPARAGGEAAHCGAAVRGRAAGGQVGRRRAAAPDVVDGLHPFAHKHSRRF